jgi:hypothetical protein
MVDRRSKDMVYDVMYGIWMHRSLLKRVVDGVLIALQFWTHRPWLLVSIVSTSGAVPVFLRYGFSRMEVLDGFDPGRCLTAEEYAKSIGNIPGIIREMKG